MLGVLERDEAGASALVQGVREDSNDYVQYYFGGDKSRLKVMGSLVLLPMGKNFNRNQFCSRGN